MPARRSLVGGLIIAVVVAGVCASVGGAAPYNFVHTGSLTMTSDPGDFIGQGLSYSFATPENPFAASGGGDRVSVSAQQAPDDFFHRWSVQLAAPPGEQLAVETYTGAVRTVSRTPGTPGMDVSGEARGCNTLTGSFTVHDLAVGPFNYVERLHATFEQHCSGAQPALRGEVSVENPPPLPLITVQVTVDPNGNLRKQGARVTGTFRCNRDAGVDISLVFTQNTKKGLVTGSTALSYDSCPTTPAAWQADVVPFDPRMPFQKGNAAGVITTTYDDPFYDVGNQDAGTVNATVLLTEG
jgi:hypothetical protein